VLVTAANEGEVTQPEPAHAEDSPVPLVLRKRAAQLLNFSRERSKVIAPLIVALNNHADRHSHVNGTTNHSANDETAIQLPLIDEVTDNSVITLEKGGKRTNRRKSSSSKKAVDAQAIGAASDLSDTVPVVDATSANGNTSTKKRVQRRGPRIPVPLEHGDATAHAVGVNGLAVEQVEVEQLVPSKPKKIRRSATSSKKQKSALDLPERRDSRAREEIASAMTSATSAATTPSPVRKRTRKPRAAE
jgi:hypothetical protein